MTTLAPGTLKTCSAMGISTVKGKLTSLSKLEQQIQKDIAEVAKAKSHQELMTAVGLGLKLTKASCDAFIALAADAMELVGLGSAGKIVGAGYGGVSTAAEAGAKQYAGEQVDLGKTAAKVATSVISLKGAQASVKAQPVNNLLSKRLGTNLPPSAGIQKLADQRNLESAKLGIKSDALTQGLFKSEIVVSAINGDKKAVKDAAIGYGKSVGTMAAGAANSKLGNIASMVGEMDSYNRALEEAFDQAQEDQDTSALDGTKRTMEKQLVKVRALIARFQSELAKCADDVGGNSMRLA